MKTYILRMIILLVLIVPVKVCAQIPFQEQVDNRTGFWNTFHKNPDSALFFAKRLASDPLGAPYLRQAVHDDMPYYFSARTYKLFKEKARAASAKNNTAFDETSFRTNFEKELAVQYRTVELLARSDNAYLAAYAHPFYIWLQIRQARASGDKGKLRALTEIFLKTELSKADLFENCAARYALLSYREISDLPGLEKLSESLLSVTISRLNTLQVKADVNTAAERVLEKRTWYRYLLAWANHDMAQRYLKTDSLKAVNYLKMAATYGPDVTDLGRAKDYISDQTLFAGEDNDPFNKEYLNYLKRDTKQKTLDALTSMAIRQPEQFKKELKTAYAASGQKQPFNTYWDASVKATLSPVPDAAIKMRDGSTFNTKTTEGKWTLVDIWGTWCGPCREEHPDLQKLYQGTLKDFGDKLRIITIACKDTESSVSNYMRQFNYSFPVALSDKKIEQTFNVLGFPTKVLISPEGKYVKVPFGVDWVSFVKAYASID